MNPIPHRVRRPVLVLASIAAATAALTAAVTTTAGAESATLSPTGSVVVTLRGNGHGHGMSQYGARGAAAKGLRYDKILAFYYPGTTLTTIAPSTIRVRLSGFSNALTVAANSGLKATGFSGPLTTTGISQYRFVPYGTSFALQQLAAKAGSTWRTLRTDLGNGATFGRTGNAPTRVFRADGSSVRYLGVIKATRSGAGAYPVNRVSLDDYTAGVVPSEMPTSWQAQAVNAQAVAARSYGRYAVENEPKKYYDICDTTQCQVYNGRTQYDRAGRTVGNDYQPAAVATANRVLRYQGKTVFAQFSASNGGCIADGGKPYLRAKSDPYDAGAPGNPYLNYTRKVGVSSLAAEYGFGKLTGIAINGRDGGGSWGGRVTSARLTGTDKAGRAKSVTVTGYSLQWAFGAGTTLFTVRRG